MSRSRASSRASTMSMLDEDPHGCCAKCCLKFPCPSIVAFFMLLVGLVCFLASVHVGATRTKFYVRGTDLDSSLQDWLDAIMITSYCVVAVMFIISVMLLAVSCLATGSTRSSFMCRFRTRKSGRCQTKMFLIIIYVLYLCWLIATCLTMVPLIFFHAADKGMCRSPLQNTDCIDLRQWGLLPYDTPDIEANICGDSLEAICEDSALRYLWFLVISSSMLVMISLVQFLVNTAANHSQIRDRYKRTHVSRNAGAYNFRTSERESLSASQRKIKKHQGRSNMPVLKTAALNGSQSIHGSVHGSNPWIDRPTGYGSDPTSQYSPDPVSSFNQDPFSTLDQSDSRSSPHDSQELNSISGLHQASSREPVYYHEYQI